jgi:hypothetical protein
MGEWYYALAGSRVRGFAGSRVRGFAERFLTGSPEASLSSLSFRALDRRTSHTGTWEALQIVRQYGEQ